MADYAEAFVKGLGGRGDACVARTGE
jgi:hypothetical protein